MNPRHAIRHPAILAVGEEFDLDPSNAGALRCREVRPGEAFTLQDAAGTWFRASLVTTSPKTIGAQVFEAMPLSPEPTLELTLACAVLGRQRMLTVMQKATELGVGRICPVLTERSIQADGLDHEKAHAWPGQVIRAVRQCRRGLVPELTEPTSLHSLFERSWWREAGARLVLDERSTGTPLPTKAASVVLLVGPEGGWTDLERRAIRESGAEPMGLGARILRAETAVLVGLVLVQNRLGDLAPD